MPCVPGSVNARTTPCVDGPPLLANIAMHHVLPAPMETR